MTKNNFSVSILILLSFVAGFFGGGLSGMIFNGDDIYENTTVLNYDEVSYASASEKASPAVVSVVARKDLSEFYNNFNYYYSNGYGSNGGLQDISNGTAFFISSDGLAMTNKHVVQDESAEYVVLMSDGTELNAEVVARDTLNDIALIKVESDEVLPYLDFANSDDLLVGEPVLALGNALGEFYNTTTAGIISALDRQIVASGSSFSENLVDLLQTDAAINPGNSGGPLVNLNGDVVGMNTAVSTSAEGIGFAIPANDLSVIVDSYLKNGRIVRPFLGVRHVLLTDSIRERFGIEPENGALIVGDDEAGLEAIVEGSAADKAGLKSGDIIITIDGEEISQSFTLQNAMAQYEVGDTAVLQVWRDGETIDVELTMEERKEE